MIRYWKKIAPMNIWLLSQLYLSCSCLKSHANGLVDWWIGIFTVFPPHLSGPHYPSPNTCTWLVYLLELSHDLPRLPVFLLSSFHYILTLNIHIFLFLVHAWTAPPSPSKSLNISINFFPQRQNPQTWPAGLFPHLFNQRGTKGYIISWSFWLLDLPDLWDNYLWCTTLTNQVFWLWMPWKECESVSP